MTPKTLISREKRMDLFIDLIWVGIVGNISDVFASKAFEPGTDSAQNAVLLFVIVFLPSWRIWNGIREILDSYYM